MRGGAAARPRVSGEPSVVLRSPPSREEHAMTSPVSAKPNLSYLSPKTAVRPSPIHGFGLFAAEPIAKDEIVAVKGGYVLGRGELSEIARALGPAEIQVGRDLFIGPRREDERAGG